MSDHRRSRPALGPVAARHVRRIGKSRSVGLRAREDVVHVRRVAAPIDLIALLGERRLLVDVGSGVELGQIMVAAVALPMIWKLRENPMFITRWAPACSTAVVLLGSFWFVERVWLT